MPEAVAALTDASSWLALGAAIWIGMLALQLADLISTASRIPRLSAYALLRDDVADAAQLRLSSAQLADFRGRLADLDGREAMRRTRAGSVTGRLWRGSPWRLIPVALSLVPLTLLIGRSAVLLSAAALILPVICYLLALAAARASVAAAGAREAMREHQRAEIVDLLAAATKTARVPVAGLGDRVRRALQLLREQQGD